ncbi:MAG: hypothetical protein WDM76_11110 [Limisphaerales bacterium]
MAVTTFTGSPVAGVADGNSVFGAAIFSSAGSADWLGADSATGVGAVGGDFFLFK